MKDSIQNQKGIALIATMMLLVLGFAVVAILFRLTTQETKLARLEQGYTAALDAAKGGADLFIYMAQNPGATTPLGTSPDQGQCLQVKLGNATQDWAVVPAWGAAGCPSQANATITDPTQYPDITFTLSNYTVNVKVLDNSTTYAMGIVGSPCFNGCFYYTVAAHAQTLGSSASEHADVLFVYRFDQ
jgi:Tfp pilus assembly protein PilX